uniref:BMA-COPB-2, isoform c n=1 Tax=Brugia malayi TaxID=6279 RepID=A0A0K0IYK8_BRUMA|nr:BMA-COPB-2, isoform c [Brugia malayi]
MRKKFSLVEKGGRTDKWMMEEELVNQITIKRPRFCQH